MSSDTTTGVRWFGARAAAAAASEAAGPFPGLRPLGAADEAEACRAGEFAASVQRASQRIAAEIPTETGNQAATA